MINPRDAYKDKNETLIAKDKNYSYLYSVNVLNNVFPLGEPIIATSPELSFNYAKYILKSRFKLAENNLINFKESEYKFGKNEFIYDVLSLAYSQKFFLFYDLDYTLPIEQYLVDIIGFNHE